MPASFTPSILLADDDRLSLVNLYDGLKEADFTVFKAETGCQAIETGLRECPDLAVLDIKMPDMDGFEVARRLFSEKQIPFIFLSAYSQQDLVRKGAEEGALGYIVKPIDVEQLIPIIVTSLDRARELRELRKTKENLNIVLNSNREVSEAIGILVGKGYADSNDEAFEKLRKYARKNEIKLKDVASQLIEQVTKVNLLLQKIADS